MTAYAEPQQVALPDGEARAVAMILTLHCADRIGIVAAVTNLLSERNGFILDSQQHAELDRGRFFMRVRFCAGAGGLVGGTERLRHDLAMLADRLGAQWRLRDEADRIRVLIAVSRASHCLIDLLHRSHTGRLPIDIVGVVSNHETLRHYAQWYDCPFHYLPVHGDLAGQERRLSALIDATGADLLVLARYMQVLSPDLVARIEGRCVNIHHSFLPSFPGANPYHRAHERGVKLIGATAHYVTADLDEGPIIEQDVERVDHRLTVDEFVSRGRDIEARVLARAVAWVATDRVLLSDRRTIVFS